MTSGIHSSEKQYVKFFVTSKLNPALTLSNWEEKQLQPQKDEFNVINPIISRRMIQRS